jgi:hypothetical protein
MQTRPAVGMDPASAQKLVAALDAEIQRRQVKRDGAQNAAWLAQFGDDGVVLLALNLRRWWGRLQKSDIRAALLTHAYQAWVRRQEEDVSPPFQNGKLAAPVSVPTSHAERAIAESELRRLVWQIHSIAQTADRLDRHDDDVRNGIVRKPHGPQVRVRVISAESLGREPKAKGANGKSVKKSRSEIWKEEQQRQLDAKQAERVAQAKASGIPLPEVETILRIGDIVIFDSRSMTGTVSIKVDHTSGRAELQFGSASFIQSGITTLSPGQSVECVLERRSDGAMRIAEIKLSVSERQAQLAEMERKAAKAEETYKIFGRRGIY